MFEGLELIDIFLILGAIYFVAITAALTIGTALAFVMIGLLSLITLPAAWLQKRFEYTTEPDTSAGELIEA